VRSPTRPWPSHCRSAARLAASCRASARCIQIRIPLEAAHYYRTGGFFDFKEHVASMGLMLLPAYWYFWKNAHNPDYDNARKGVTLVLAAMCWFMFIVGHVLNNTRGFAS
jgi:hypothetical protein